MTSAALYLRVSTEEQVSNLSLDTQEAEARELCAKKGWSIAEVFREEGASAKTLERPEIRRLLDYLGKARGKVAYVVVLRVDRLSRNRDDFYLLRHALRRHGVRIVSVREEIADDSISAMIVETFSVLQAQVDNLIRAGRAKTGMAEAARRGRWVWQAPIGYRHARSVDGRAAGLELDPEMAPLVARAFELVAGGVPVDAAYRELGKHLKGRGGRPIGRQTFHAIFRRQLYTGRLEVASWGIASASAAPAIVDETTFARARAMLAMRSRVRHATATLRDFPLRGVTHCTCGRKLVAYHARGRSGRRWPYYRCHRCKVQIPAKGLDTAFVRLLGRLAAPEAVVALVDRLISVALEDRAAEVQARLASARRRMTAAERKIERLISMRAEEELSQEDYRAARAKADTERDAARLEIADLTEPLEVDRLVAGSWARRFLTQPEAIWTELDGDRRATFVERVFPDGLTLQGGELANRGNSLLGLDLRGLASGAGELVGPTERRSNRPIEYAAWRRKVRELEAELIGQAA